MLARTAFIFDAGVAVLALDLGVGGQVRDAFLDRVDGLLVPYRVDVLLRQALREGHLIDVPEAACDFADCFGVVLDASAYIEIADIERAPALVVPKLDKPQALFGQMTFHEIAFSRFRERCLVHLSVLNRSGGRAA